MKTAKERLLHYVKFNTQSAHESESYPSTACQLDLAKALAEECRQIGLSDVEMDSYGYVTAALPKNTSDDKPVIGFLAHMDTSPDASGENVKPQVIENYDGGDIQLSENIVLSPEEFPALKNYIGQELIVTDGTTLLGADNKAGIAEIMTAMEYLINHPEIPHGTVKIAFTPDEEVGGGVDHFDVKKFGADFAYTVDGGELGEFSCENFNAAGAKIYIKGKSVHPGASKGIMINAALIALEMAAEFPSAETPAETDGYQGFYHLGGLNAGVENAKLDYIIRCFSLDEFESRKTFIKNLVDKYNKKYPGRITLELNDQYLDMKEKIAERPEIIELAMKAFKLAGVEPDTVPTRGGTDGSRLSYMGLPCPNIFTGGHNYHGPFEYIPVPSMDKAVEVIVNICKQ